MIIILSTGERPRLGQAASERGTAQRGGQDQRRLIQRVRRTPGRAHHPRCDVLVQPWRSGTFHLRPRTNSGQTHPPAAMWDRLGLTLLRVEELPTRHTQRREGRWAGAGHGQAHLPCGAPGSTDPVRTSTCSQGNTRRTHQTSQTSDRLGQGPAGTQLRTKQAGDGQREDSDAARWPAVRCSPAYLSCH